MIVVFLLAVFMAGAFIFTYDSMKDIYAALILIIKKAAGTFKGTDLTDRSEMWERVRIVLGITLGMGKDRSVKAFFGLSGALSAVVMVVLAGKVSLWLNALAAVSAAFLPYILLRIKMEDMRVSGSHEGERMLAELTENYKINYYNMKEAIDKTAISLKKAPGSQKILANLSRGLDRAASERSMMKLLEEFSLSINTSWANTLKNLMYFALVHGIRVDEALEDLLGTLNSARAVEEFSKRENNESSMMIKYLVPLTYLMTVYAGVEFFGLGAEKFLEYQFQTEVGTTWFTIFILVYTTSYIVNSFLSRNKLDL
jgi:hypothetical protein